MNIEIIQIQEILTIIYSIIFNLNIPSGILLESVWELTSVTALIE